MVRQFSFAAYVFLPCLMLALGTQLPLLRLAIVFPPPVRSFDECIVHNGAPGTRVAFERTVRQG